MLNSIPRVGRGFLDKTAESWRDWMRNLNVPFEWQEAVIRAAITLQLCSFEQTGAIVAALTTSVPEAPREQRNWDYRYCWIRDAYFTVQALNRVGASPTMERFIEYVTNVIAMERGPKLKPVYGVLPEKPLEERIAPDLAGYRGFGPVRIGNDAVNQVQHDVYGSVILAASQMFFDERLPKKGDESAVRLLEPLGMRALALALTPDAGIWEYRDKPAVHTYSAAMCWVACDRLARIATRLGCKTAPQQWRKSADGLREAILARAWNAEMKCFAGQLDSRPDRRQRACCSPNWVWSRRRSEIHFDGRGHRQGAWAQRLSAPLCRARRFRRADSTAFTICTFWYVEALAAIGRCDEARALVREDSRPPQPCRASVGGP